MPSKDELDAHVTLEKAKVEASVTIEKAKVEAGVTLDKARVEANLTLEKARVVERLTSLETKFDTIASQNERIIAHLISEFGGEDPVTGLVTEGKVTTSLKDLKATVDKLEEKVGKQNGRVGALEGFKSYASGGIAVLGVLFCAVIVATVNLLIHVNQVMPTALAH